MSISENTRRRNQIIAQRSAEKVLRAPDASWQKDRVLWDTVTAVLEETVKLRGWSGHVDKACEAARALSAARELKLRGTQLQLPA